MWRPAALGWILLALASTARAAEQSPPLTLATFRIGQPANVAAEGVAKPWAPFLVQPVRAERAARLEAEITVSGAGLLNKRTLPAGERLFAALAAPDRVYCAPGRTKTRDWSGLDFLCLDDTDGDGAFDRAAFGEESGPVWIQRLVGVLDDRTVSDLVLGDYAPLPRPVRYVEVDSVLGPEANMSLRWRVHRNRASGGAVTLIVWSNTGSNQVWSRVLGPELKVTLASDQTGQFSYNGAIVDVLGFTGKGELRYRIVSPMPDQPAKLDIRPLPNVITIYR